MNNNLKTLLLVCIILVISGWYGLLFAFANLYWMEYMVQYFPAIEYTFEHQLRILGLCMGSFFAISIYSLIARRSFLPALRHVVCIVILNIVLVVLQTPVPQGNFVTYAFEQIKAKS